MNKQTKRVPKVARSALNAKPKRTSNPKVYMMPKGGLPSVASLPSTYMTSTIDPTWLRMEGKISHPELGGGIRVAGRQLLTSITTAAGAELFEANGATLTSARSIALSPDALNGRVALQARNYDRYIFRKVALTYVSRVPTTQVGSFALAYVADGGFSSSLTFANVTSMSPCLQASVHCGCARIVIVDDMRSDKSFFTLLDTASAASSRQTVQGMIVGSPDVSGIGAVNMGFVYIDYLVDFYQPTIDQGFSLRLTEEEMKFIQERRVQRPVPKPISVNDILSRLEKCEQILEFEEEEERELAHREPTPLRGKLTLR